MEFDTTGGGHLAVVRTVYEIKWQLQQKNLNLNELEHDRSFIRFEINIK